MDPHFPHHLLTNRYQPDCACRCRQLGASIPCVRSREMNFELAGEDTWLGYPCGSDYSNWQSGQPDRHCFEHGGCENAVVLRSFFRNSEGDPFYGAWDLLQMFLSFAAFRLLVM